MAQALYREWRPQTFDDVVEQDHVISALKQAVISNELGHAYLFTGTRGTGKTTMAKILARAVNCLHPRDGNPDNSCEICQAVLNNTLTDVAEIDAASHNSVDNIRQITEEIIFTPARAKYKVYIIDEVHMLSTGAFNALLKTLEEPPAHAIFILATTEPHRLPVTVLSRCQRYDFKRISENSITERLQLIAANEKITIDSAALRAISLLADGALRDAISLLDQAKISFPNGATETDIRRMAGQVDRRFMIELVLAIVRSDVITILTMLDQMIKEGQDIVRFTHELASFYRDLLIIHASGDTTTLQSGALAGLIHASDAEINQMKELAAHYQQPEVVTRITQLSTLISDLRWSPNPRVLLEVGIMRLIGTRASEVSAKLTQAPATTAPAPQQTMPQATPKPVVPVTTATDPVARTTATNPVAQAPVAAAAPQPTVAANRVDTAPTPAKPAVDAKPSMAVNPRDEELMDETDERIPEDDFADRPYMDYDDYPDYDDRVPMYDDPTPAAYARTETRAAVTESRPPAVEKAAGPVARQLTDERDAQDAWAKILNTMQKDDMFCYLFAKEAKVKLADGGLLILFAEEEKAHYNVFSGDRGIKTLRESMLKGLGHMLPYRVAMDGVDGDASDEEKDKSPDWQDAIARTAESLGIPVERKD